MILCPALPKLQPSIKDIIEEYFALMFEFEDLRLEDLLYDINLSKCGLVSYIQTELLLLQGWCLSSLLRSLRRGMLGPLLLVGARSNA